MLGLLTGVAGLAVLVQGGYFPQYFLMAGVVLGLGLAFVPRWLPRAPWFWVMLGLSVWYVGVTALQGGDLGQSGLPLVCTLFAGCLSMLDARERREFLRYQCGFGGIVAALGVLTFFGIIPLAGAVTAGRLQFTFQYVNALGSWLAALAVLRWQEKGRWMTVAYPVMLLALGMTRSVGALGLYLVVQVAVLVVLHRKNLKKRHILVTCGCLVPWVIALSTRWEEMLGTFAERLTHTHDGFLALLASPLFGYGAGTWGTVKEAFASYDYRATVIHNSYMQVAVSGGVIALALLICALCLVLPRLKNRPAPWVGAAVLLVGHALLDFTLCFFAIDCLALALLVPQQGGKPLPRGVQIAIGLGGSALCALLWWGVG